MQRSKRAHSTRVRNVSKSEPWSSSTLRCVRQWKGDRHEWASREVDWPGTGFAASRSRCSSPLAWCNLLRQCSLGFGRRISLTGKAADLKSAGPTSPWGFESLILRHTNRCESDSYELATSRAPVGDVGSEGGLSNGFQTAAVCVLIGPTPGRGSPRHPARDRSSRLPPPADPEGDGCRCRA